MIPAVFCTVIPVAAGAAILAVRSRAAEETHKRRGLLAAAFGVAAFVPALLGPSVSGVGSIADPILVVCGGLTILFAVIAVGLSVWAVRARPAGARYPLAGFLLGTVNLACGTGLFVTGSGVLAPAEGKPWTWRNDDHGFEVTIPTGNWVLRSNPNVLAEFQCPRPVLIGVVGAALPAATDEEFEAGVARSKKKWIATPLTNSDEQTGPNCHGKPHWRMMGDARNGDKNYFFGASVTHVGGKAVVLMFEGPYRLSSEAGRAQEAHALRTQADLFLGSVR